MIVFRWNVWGLAAVLAAGVASARECEAVFAECKDDCSLQYGSIRIEMKKRFAKCMKRCGKEATRCTEQEVEARSNNLDEGALEKSPSSADVDSDDGEAEPSPSKEKAKAKAKGKKKRVASQETEGEGDREEPPARREALRDDEVPASSRTPLKTDEKGEKPAERSPEREPHRDEPAPSAPKPADDRARAAEAPAEKEKREEKKAPPPKKKEEEEDLRNF